MILLNDFPRQWAEMGPELTRVFSETGASGWYILGSRVEAFEKKLAAYWGLPFACGTGNGLDAIEIALRVCGLKPGDKVLTTPLSAFATTLAVLRAGGHPVFVDTDPAGQLDLKKCENLLRKDPSIRFLLPVHLFGRCLDLEQLAGIVAATGVTLIEDCAQSIGAAFKGRRCGTVGRMAATSFYPTKNLGALGDGGALLTRDAALAEKSHCLSNYGQSAKYVHSELGMNSRLDELQAALLSELLTRLDHWTAKRVKVGRAYDAGIRNPRIEKLGRVDGASDVDHLYPVLLKNADARDQFKKHLEKAGIQSGVHYPILIPSQKSLLDAPHTVVGDLAVSTRLTQTELSLPIHPQLTDSEINQVIEACNSWQN